LLTANRGVDVRSRENTVIITDIKTLVTISEWKYLRAFRFQAYMVIVPTLSSLPATKILAPYQNARAKAPKAPKNWKD
jgi:hypothetical protein